MTFEAPGSVRRDGMDVVLVDPSLFTAPYDAGLSEGLKQAGIRPHWMTRPLRPGEQAELKPEDCDPFFYRSVERASGMPARLRGLAKGGSHFAGLWGLVRRVRALRPAAVHIQWAVLPAFDAAAMRLMQSVCPVVMTVHDTVPFNGQSISFLQNSGFDLPIKAADRVIVHTQSARDNLIARGVAEEKLSVVPHGPLSLRASPRPRPVRDGRFTFVLFGQIKPYKGLDLAVEALGRLSPELRGKGRLVVAGAPQMDMAPITARIAELGLGDTVELRLARLDNQEMADLFDEADAFLFPYRQIDASGVYFLLKPLGKWMVASRVGIFAEDIEEGTAGALVPPGDVAALAASLEDAIVRRPAGAPATDDGSWEAIGLRMRSIYEDLASTRTTATARSKPARDA